LSLLVVRVRRKHGDAVPEPMRSIRGRRPQGRGAWGDSTPCANARQTSMGHSMGHAEHTVPGKVSPLGWEAIEYCMLFTY
jgi:hypothetical protein